MHVVFVRVVGECCCVEETVWLAVHLWNVHGLRRSNIREHYFYTKGNTVYFKASFTSLFTVNLRTSIKVLHNISRPLKMKSTQMCCLVTCLYGPYVIRVFYNYYQIKNYDSKNCNQWNQSIMNLRIDLQVFYKHLSTFYYLTLLHRVNYVFKKLIYNVVQYCFILVLCWWSIVRCNM